MSNYSIKDLENLSGIMAHTIRIWEKRYNIFEPYRTATNRRRYSDRDLRKIINISILNRNGLKISAIASLSDKEIAEKVNSFSQDLSQTDTQIESLMVAMIDMDDIRFTEVLSRSIDKLGFENAFMNIVFPFLQRTGLLWQTGTINPSHEHFTSNIFRQKIISHIDLLPAINIENKKRIIMYLPEKELHEMGLLYYNYLAQKEGHSVLYLGQLTPFESVVYSAKTWGADVIVTGTLTSFAEINIKDYSKKLAAAFDGKRVILAGLLTSTDILKHSSNVIKVNTPDQFIKALEKK